jgi:ribonuclease HI
MSDKPFALYLSGLCQGNFGMGAWAMILHNGHDKSCLTGFEWETTENRMVLCAAIAGMRRVKPCSTVVIITDSEYLYKGGTVWLDSWRRQGWYTKERKPVKNMDLWQDLVNLMNGHLIKWRLEITTSKYPKQDEVKDMAINTLNELKQKRKIIPYVTTSLE